MGHISIYSLPALRRQTLFDCVKPTDITALSSLQFTPYAHALYLQSSSEFTEVTLSSKNTLSYAMMISYDKLQRKTILQFAEDKSNSQISSSRDESSEYIKDLPSERLSKDSVFSSTTKTLDVNDYKISILASSSYLCIIE